MNNELLQRYVEGRSEEAFTELVKRHLDLVYCAALRQVDGDTAAAQDVTQAVFTDLARKAAQLTRHASLTGWLYTSTRFQAAKARRSEQRRRAREQQAHTMSQLLHTTDAEPCWKDIGPVLDEVMHELKSADREAVLMRYFEERPLAEIGARLGLSDNAARMRVERSLDKLREALGRRGISLTLAALGATLCARAVQAAPSGLINTVSRTAFAMSTGGGVALLLWKLAASTSFKWGTVAALLLVVGIAVTWSQRSAPSRAGASAAVEGALSANVAAKEIQSEEILPGPSNFVASSSPELVSTNKLVLHIVAQDNGQPIPSASMDYWFWESGKVNHRKPLISSRSGICEVPVPRDKVTRLILVSEVDGFVDTRLEWNVERGALVPDEYTLRLVRAIRIGGRVVDADDQPVAGAEVGFNNRANPAQETFPESRNFAWPFWIVARTDTEGRWRMERVSQEMLRTLDGGASHSNHVHSSHISLNESDVQKEMLAETHVFRLGRAVTVSGIVVDAQEQPVAGAKIRVGAVGMSGSREGTAAPDGTFRIAGCNPGKSSLSAEAEGFAPLTQAVELSADAQPYRLTLQPGKLLRLLVVDSDGAPIKGANAWLDTFERNFLQGSKAPPIQTSFNRRTDAAGRIEWNEAPDQELNFDFSAKGFMRVSGFKVRPDGQQHVITLPPALTISGTVRDADTGELVPRFRIITGWPQHNPISGENTEQWSTIDRFWLSFEGGKFNHVYEEPVVVSTPSHGFVFKVEAEGYASCVTRVVGPEESKAEFDIRLTRANSQQVTALLPDGRPAAHADVGFISPGAHLRLVPGGFDTRQVSSSQSIADDAGRFELKPDPRVQRIIVAHPEGFAATTVAALAANPTVTLQPWGRLEGSIGGDTTKARALLFQYESGDFSSISCDFSRYQVKTDSAGRFVFPQAPPGKHQLVELIPDNSGGNTVWSHNPLTAFEILPGKTTTLAVQAKSSEEP